MKKDHLRVSLHVGETKTKVNGEIQIEEGKFRKLTTAVLGVTAL